MQLSLNWLKDFVHIPKKITPEKLAMLLTQHTVEVEKVAKQADKYDKVVVGKILAINQHPNADRLKLVKVDVKDEKLDIVCGAANIEVGQLVPVALVGAVLPNGLEIKQAEVRGEKSSGMLCAPDELGLGEDHAGILILTKAKAGQAFSQYLKLDDVVLEVDNKSITHRPDLWSHYGMAREISAFLDVRLKDYNANSMRMNALVPIISGNDANINLQVKVEDYELCPRYMAVALDNIKVEPSPKWLADRLIAAGSRPINNIVDITNYVMLELGQPMHAFDASLIQANDSECDIIVRKAKHGEAIETLDGEMRKLEPGMLVIANASQPLAVAGVMGGAESEISHETKTVILESANFNFVSVRKTAQKLAMRTDASMRFEKALDPNLCEQGLAQAVVLIKQVCPAARVVSQLADEKKFELNQGPIMLELDWLKRRLGQKISGRQVAKILQRLGFAVVPASAEAAPLVLRAVKKSALSVTVPTWRATRDIALAEDLVEEVARIYGYNNIAAKMPEIVIEAPLVNEERALERKIINALAVGANLAEVYNYSFTNAERLDKLGIDRETIIKLVNPISSEQNLLRPNLITNLVENIITNQAREEEIGLFEIGNIFLNRPGDIKKDNTGGENLPYQAKRLGLVVAADNGADVFSKLKGKIEYLLKILDLEVGFGEVEVGASWSEKKLTAAITINGRNIGLAALLAKKVAASLGLKKPAALAEIYLRELYDLISKQPRKMYEEFAKYPPVKRDLAFVVDEEIRYNDIKREIINFSPLVKHVELFDIYQGGKLGPGKKNLAFSVIYQADKTLTSAEVDQLQAALLKKLAEKWGAQIRNF